MIYRSKAPLRIGLAGGGTDVSPYSDLYGGAILNATVSLYARAAIEPLDNGQVIFECADRREFATYDAVYPLPIDGNLDLLKGVINRVYKDYGKFPSNGFKLTTFVDAPAGSGLGTSSTLVVAVLGAFAEWLKLPLGEYDLAHLAYSIEREDLQQAGGKQDQYAATFGGVNFMEFYKNDKVIVNPLRIKDVYLHELENNLVLFYTSTSRLSSSIISEQQKNVTDKKDDSIEAMHHLKDQAVMMKEALLRGSIDKIGEILDYGFEYKKKMAKGITNPQLDEIYEAARKAGASGGKISGAGGGGFMIFYCPKNTRFAVVDVLKNFGGDVKRYSFTNNGIQTWSI
ncbi:D-glycero-alpha-D-manno-heptose-7-phosphate kinase [Chitinophaga terrae (ex Kim and Jung 2007)]|uniref:D-glycero-alpha-D-manno-heptose-7-phosphate kinase n=1 Tax=Chitinophaga terrae (ex Kim and Jung 2007) TaxID=408074 RepID=A0A1H3ZA85_9BACT|nr:dehydrogenase [Chitinophaga terrae (ex Kim and Jung 2007)]GEP88648.1 dehydrogenase [Chitinophaga terrae (ex Kim and Jung 2007)]SEA20597.1 D-glycero-alpha-D-manno-heptose-7-phosphate kinase [Chitinophaga terrae (ex Kim and Jung 2007)]